MSLELQRQFKAAPFDSHTRRILQCLLATRQKHGQHVETNKSCKQSFTIDDYDNPQESNHQSLPMPKRQQAPTHRNVVKTKIKNKNSSRSRCMLSVAPLQCGAKKQNAHLSKKKKGE
jgi:hypothetical protein